MNEQPLEERREKLKDLISDIQFAMLTTVGPDGRLRSRPMTVQQQEEDHDLWFFAGRSNDIVREIEASPRINLAFVDDGDHRYVSVSGTAHVVEDRAKAEEIWNPVMEAYFPQGVDDPDLCLLRVTVESAEYWDSKSGLMVKAVDLINMFTGAHPQHPGENATIELAGETGGTPT